MKIIVAAVIIALFSGSAAVAEEVFGSWMIFPGPNPDAADLLPDSHSDDLFRIGQIIFEYPYDRIFKNDDPVQELSELQSVADAVRATTPGPALRALVDEQLSMPHEFHFDSATVLDGGDAGLMWEVEYVLFPKMGGASGRPFRYRAVLTGRGNLILPTMSVFDAFFHSPKEGWICSVLRLPPSGTPDEAALTAEEIRSRATESLRNAATANQSARSDAMGLSYTSQELIRIPTSTDANGDLIFTEIWAVNFHDPAREARPDERFTVWVTVDGRTADLQHLDHWWDVDDQDGALESPTDD